MNIGFVEWTSNFYLIVFLIFLGLFLSFILLIVIGFEAGDGVGGLVGYIGLCLPVIVIIITLIGMAIEIRTLKKLIFYKNKDTEQSEKDFWAQFKE